MNGLRILAWMRRNAIALLALFVALGGTGYAAVQIDGNLIKDHSIKGKKLKKNTLGGAQIKESKLTAVPRARLADNAGALDSLDSSAFARGHAATALFEGRVLPSTSNTVAQLAPLGEIKVNCISSSTDPSEFSFVATSNQFVVVELRNSDGNSFSYLAKATGDHQEASVNASGGLAEIDAIAINDPGVGSPVKPAGARVHWHVRGALNRLGGACVYSVIATKVTG